MLAGRLAADLAGGGDFFDQPDHVFERVVCGAQHVELLLGKVADVQALAFEHFAFNRRQRAGDGFHHGGLALAVGAQNADALAGQHRLADVLHDDRGRCAFGCVFRGRVAEVDVLDRQHGVGQVGRLFELEGEVGFGQQRRDFLHAVQRLDAALRLLGFAGLGLEAGNELLQVGDFVLLLGVSALLQRHLLGAQVFKLAVVAAVAREFGALDVHGDVGHGI